jgi:hypothetical protein
MNPLHGQFGMSFRYNMNDASEWNDFLAQQYSIQTTKVHNPSFEVSFDYWMRLKNYRIEFFPEIYYNTSSSELILSLDGHNFTSNNIGFNANVSFYLFDLEGDCDCPTFSKQGTFFSKGFYLQFSPGITYSSFSQEQSIKQSASTISYKIGFGAGIDIGLTNLFTITPHIRYNIFPSVTWDEFQEFHIEPSPDIDNSSGLSQIQFGIRLGFRPDYRGNRF